ncbi:zinc finger and SCAN domain-containing protein 31 [Anabrus simplex]|uniref:zinc finger and SCAN domain-containing protein 31 n=1 Tax=Anabrus simplex TaxID=316456 RepID=UPI0035A29827
MRGKKCAVFGCSNYEVQKDARSFFRFPREEKMCDLWVLKCHRSDLDELYKKEGTLRLNKRYKICSDHFQASDFRNPRQYSQGLKPGSVPTQNLPKVKTSIATAPSKRGSPSKRRRQDDETSEPDENIRAGSPAILPNNMADESQIKCEPQSSPEDSQIWVDVNSIKVEEQWLSEDENTDILEPHAFYIKEENQSDDNTDPGKELPYPREMLDIKEEVNDEAVPVVGDSKKHQSLKTSGRSRGTFSQDLSKNRHICSQCGKSFRTPSKLNRHTLVHSGEKPYSCKYCGKTFQQKVSLGYHISVHTEGRTRQRHSCPICGKTFRERSGLVRHEAVHCGERTQHCPTCRKKFTQKSHLQRHMQTHSKTKDYKCSYCEKRFGDPSALAPHVRVHTGERPYTCELCGMSFIQKCHLVRHMPRKHGSKKQKGEQTNSAK